MPRRRKPEPLPLPHSCSLRWQALHLSPLHVTGIKLVPSPSLSFCAGRPSTALWTRAPHPKVASPAPTTTQSWGCTIPKMTSHSEKQVGLPFPRRAASHLCHRAQPSDLILLKKKGCCQKAGFQAVLCFPSPLSICSPFTCHCTPSVPGSLGLLQGV